MGLGVDPPCQVEKRTECENRCSETGSRMPVRSFENRRGWVYPATSKIRIFDVAGWIYTQPRRKNKNRHDLEVDEVECTLPRRKCDFSTWQGGYTLNRVSGVDIHRRKPARRGEYKVDRRSTPDRNENCLLT